MKGKSYYLRIIAVICLISRIKTDMCDSTTDFIALSTDQNHEILIGKITQATDCTLSIINLQSIATANGNVTNLVFDPKLKKLYSVVANEGSGIITSHDIIYDEATAFPTAKAISDTNKATVIYEGKEPTDVTVDGYGNVYFLDRGLQFIGKISKNDIENGRRFVRILYTSFDTKSMNEPMGIYVDRKNDYLYWTNRKSSSSNGIIHKAYTEPFVMMKPFEKMLDAANPESGALSTIGFESHIYYLNTEGKLYRIKHALYNNGSHKLMSSTTFSNSKMLQRYKEFLLIPGEQSNGKGALYYVNMYGGKMKEKEANMVKEDSGLLNNSKPFGMAIIHSADFTSYANRSYYIFTIFIITIFGLLF